MDYFTYSLQPFSADKFYTCFADTITEADRMMFAATSVHPSKASVTHMCWKLFKVPVLPILFASQIFTSKGEMIRAIKGKGVKINRVTIESPDEMIEQGDFLNFYFLPHAHEYLQEYGKGILMIQNGKQRSLVQVSLDRSVKVLV